MFKTCFINFVRNLKYIFVELGFMYLALMLGIDLFVKRVGIGINEFKEAFTQMWESGNLDLFLEGVQKVFQSLLTGVIGFFVVQLLGLVLGYILIMIFIRTDIERRNIFKVLLSAIVDGVILVLFFMLMTFILKQASWGVIVGLLLFLPLYSLVTLAGSYINHGLATINFRSAVSIKNIIKLSTINLLTIAATILLGLLFMTIFNIFVGIVLTVALFIVGICTISLNADSYVTEIVAKRKIELQVNKATLAVVENIDNVAEKAFDEPQPNIEEQPKVEEQIKDEPLPKAEEQPKVEETK